MLRFIPFRFAIQVMLVLLFLVLIFHVLVLTQIIPDTIVWGGKFENADQLQQMELVSILVNAILLFLILVKGTILKIKLPALLITILLWIFVVLFFLNTIGNLFAETMTEKIIFTPLTLISAFFCLRIVTEKKAAK